QEPKRHAHQWVSVREIGRAINRVQSPDEVAVTSAGALLLPQKPDLRRLLCKVAAQFTFNRVVELGDHVAVALGSYDAGLALQQHAARDVDRVDRDGEVVGKIGHSALRRSQRDSKISSNTAYSPPTDARRWTTNVGESIPRAAGRYGC